MVNDSQDLNDVVTVSFLSLPLTKGHRFSSSNDTFLPYISVGHESDEGLTALKAWL